MEKNNLLMAEKRYWQYGTARPKAAWRDFGKKRHGNPLFHPPTRSAAYRRRRAGHGDWRFPWRALLFAVILAAVGWVAWYFLWSDAFRLRNIQVSGATPEIEAAVDTALRARLAQHAFLVLPEANAVIFSVEGATADIAKAVYLDKIVIRKKFPDTLTVSVVEKQPAAVLAAQNRLFVLDGEGYVVRELTEGEAIRLGQLPADISAISTQDLGSEVVDVKDLATAPADNASAPGGTTAAPTSAKLTWPIVVVDNRDNGKVDRSPEPRPGLQAVPPEAMSLILAADPRLPQITGTAVRWFTVRPLAETVEAAFTDGWSAYFSTARPFSAQAERLAIILKEKIKDRRSQLSYIDLRFEEKIFLRYREEAPTKVAPAPSTGSSAPAVPGSAPNGNQAAPL